MLDLIVDAQLFTKPEDPLRSRIVEMMDDEGSHCGIAVMEREVRGRPAQCCDFRGEQKRTKLQKSLPSSPFFLRTRSKDGLQQEEQLSYHCLHGPTVLEAQDDGQLDQSGPRRDHDSTFLQVFPSWYESLL